jgi:hypothetical protein
MPAQPCSATIAGNPPGGVARGGSSMSPRNVTGPAAM